ncbi:MAG: endonuclease VIII [Calditrichota bacterium]
MPEGPEIRLAADKIAKAIVEKPVEEIFFAFEHLKHYEELFTGDKILRIETYGKAMLTRFANGWNIYSHNQLYGKWQVVKRGNLPQTNRQLRLAIHVADKSALLYSASDIEVLPDEEVAHHPFIARIGPDLLSPDITLERVREQFTDKRFFRRGLLSLLLDQKFLAGVGNYLRSEILYVAGVHPSMRPKDCTEEQLDKLAEAALNLTRQSYKTKGITNDLERVKQLKSAGFTRREYRHHVFVRHGLTCYDCEDKIVKEISGGRKYCYCPTCQAR